MYDENKIKSCFPFPAFRSYQEEVLADIIKSFNSGVEVYLLNGPVGFGKCIKKGSRVFGESRIRPIEDAPNKVITPIGKVKSSYINGVVNSGNKHVVTIKTRFGYELSCTPEHPIAILEGGEISWIEAKNSVGKHCLISKSVVKGEKQFVHIDGIYNGSSVIKFPVDIEIDGDFAEFFGLYVAEGSGYKGTSGICTSDIRNYDLCNLVADKIGCNIRIKHKNDNKSFDIMMYHKSFSDLLINVFGRYSTTKVLPNIIFDLDVNERARFLYGYFNGDGYVNKGNIAVSTSSKELANDIRMLLLSLGICSSIRTRKTYRSDSHEITINSEDFETFYNVIGDFRDGKMLELINKKRNSNLDTIPNCKELIRRLLNDFKHINNLSHRKALDKLSELGVYGLVKSWLYDNRNKQSPTRSNLNKVLDVMGTFTDSHIKLWNIANLPVLYDIVVDVSDNNEEAYVYDIEVPMEHHFVADGFVVHNSPVGIAMGRMTDVVGTKGPQQPFGAYYLSPQNVLVDQLEREKAFSPFIALIKGRDHYSPCLVSGFDDKTCKFGKCQMDDSYECEELCSYKEARDIARVSQICVSNFVYMIIVSDFLFGERDLLIVDEVHSAPKWGLNFVTCTIWSKDIETSIPELETFNQYIEWLGVIDEKFEKDLNDVLVSIEDANENGEINLGLKEKKDHLKEIIDKIGRLLDDYEKYKEEWVWTVVDKGSKKERIQFQPITAGRFLENLIWRRGKKKLLMSGTIFPELFVEEAGLTDKICEYKEIPSTFPVENRPIFYWPCGKMSKDYRDITLPKMSDRVVVIAIRNKGKNGFAHCGSYNIAEYIYQRVKPILGDKVVLQDEDDREGSLQRWIEADNKSLFLSVNMTEGVDLKDDICRYQINCKVQFPYLGDKRVKARMDMKRYVCNLCKKDYRTTKELTGSPCSCGGKYELNMNVHIYTCQVCGKKFVTSKDMINCGCGGLLTKQTFLVDGSYWYDMQAVTDLVQSYGRPVRSETDQAEYWLLDESFMRLYKKRYSSFPKLFKEAVKVIK